MTDPCMFPLCHSTGREWCLNWLIKVYDDNNVCGVM